MFNERLRITADNENILFIKMALKNVDFALISVDYILNTHRINYDIYKDDHTFYFYYIQNLLAACGNIINVFDNSSNLWRKPNGVVPRERSKILCRLIDLNLREYPLIFKRAVRNINMHSDEHYDWNCRRLGDYNIIDENTPLDEKDEILNTPHLRTYDKQNQIYITVGTNGRRIEFPLNRLRQELNALKYKLENIKLVEGE